MCGYLNRPEENARRVVDGWHRTNDLGKRLSDGSLVFVGPKTTMIKTGIENVYPAEVEAALRAHPGVADVCVIGVPDPRWDQNVKALVIRKPATDASRLNTSPEPLFISGIIRASDTNSGVASSAITTPTAAKASANSPSRPRPCHSVRTRVAVSRAG